MDLGVQKHKVCNRNGAAIAVESVKGVNGKEATEAEKESLLGSEEKGAAAADKNKKRVARKVQWNDRKGSDLVEVLEFEPSDASDSEEDEYLDSCLCIIIRLPPHRQFREAQGKSVTFAAGYFEALD